MKLKSAITIYCLLVMSACFTACKKDRSGQPGNLLAGDWRGIQPGEQYVSLKFNNNKTFWLSTIIAGTSNQYSGSYVIQGNDLKLQAAEVLVHEPGKPVQKNVINEELFQGATFTIKSDTLTLNYQSHTAVWPRVSNTIKFHKMLTID